MILMLNYNYDRNNMNNRYYYLFIIKIYLLLGIIDTAAGETAKILKFFDTLFDNVNGHTLWPMHGKQFECAVSETSGHFQY